MPIKPSVCCCHNSSGSIAKETSSFTGNILCSSILVHQQVNVPVRETKAPRATETSFTGIVFHVHSMCSMYNTKGRGGWSSKDAASLRKRSPLAQLGVKRMLRGTELKVCSSHCNNSREEQKTQLCKCRFHQQAPYPVSGHSFLKQPEKRRLS